jgi:hypothetical protein
MLAFRWFTGEDFREWSRMVLAKTEFPRVLSRMIRATTLVGTELEFPAGIDALNGGWDGIVKCSSKTDYVPEGISLWELGTEKDNNGKANAEYAKRSADPLGFNPAECVFVFATPNYWKAKDAWRIEKLKDNIWKDIKVMDSRNLEEWIAYAPAVAWEMATLYKGIPDNGVQSAADFWKTFSSGPRITLQPAVVTAGRNHEMQQLGRYLASKPDSVMAVQAFSKEEATAFIVAAAAQFELQASESFYAKTLIVETKQSFRSMCTNRFNLVMIGQLEERNELNRGIADGHHVLLPLGPDDTSHSKDIIILPKPDRGLLVNSLAASGVDEEQALNLVINSGINITILKKLLGFTYEHAEWSVPEFSRMAIPALLLGKWNEDVEGDREIVERLSGKKYDEYIGELSRWKTNKIPFVYQIGTHWRLASPLDAWTQLSAHITRHDLERLKICFLEVLQEISPSFDLAPEQRMYASMLGKIPLYSHSLREGLTQSLILIALHGNHLSLPIGSTSQVFVNEIVYELLSPADGKRWMSLEHLLPLIAEAAPETFLDVLDDILQSHRPSIMEMFKEEPGLMFENSHHAGLLWAIESLAWIPEWLTPATVQLARLARLDPGGKLTNRPIASLRNIFLPWYPQTEATAEQRHLALELITRNEPETAWKLMLQLARQHHSIAHPTNKTKWRVFERRTITTSPAYEEMYKDWSFCTEHLIALAGFDEKRLAILVNISADQWPWDREKILKHIIEHLTAIPRGNHEMWHETRKILHRHRSHPDTEWSIPETGLKDYAYIYAQMRPKNILDQHQWLFNDHWPEFAEGHKREHPREEQEIIDERRQEGIRQIYLAYGLDAVDRLVKKVTYKDSVGKAAAHVLNRDEEIEKFLSEEKLTSKEWLPAAQSFIWWKHRAHGWEWVINIYEKSAQKQYSKAALANILLPIFQTQEILDFIETIEPQIQEFYWKEVRPFFYNNDLGLKKYVLVKLMEAGRGLTVIDELVSFVDELDSPFIEQILERAVSSKEDRVFPSYELEEVLKKLGQRSDMEKSRIALLEWKYLPILSRRYDPTRSMELFNHLSASPSFFVDLLKLVYMPDNEKVDPASLTEDEKKEIAAKARHAYALLSEWNQVPGLNQHQELDREHLKSWVKETRELAKTQDRLDVADTNIGRILSHYPEDINQQWPPDAICEIVDTINSRKLNTGFSTGTFNKRGSYSKMPFAGGQRERNIAAFFQRNADQIAVKWPVTSRILRELARGYEIDAKREDERAQRDALDR